MFDFVLLEKEVKRIGGVINAHESLLVINTAPIGDGTPHVEFKSDGCFYVSSERGHEIFREKITDLNELLYRIFERITTRMATDYELENRVESQDCRRLIFDKKLDLLGKISSDWANREKKEITKTLVASPYDDLASTRATYCRKLREGGMSESDINKLAYKKYPSPQKKSQASTQKQGKTYWEKYFDQ